MMLTRRLKISAVAALSAVATALPVPAGTVHAAAPPRRYVALGDSYAAGPSIPGQVDLACLRSDHNYPSLVAASLRAGSFRDVSCSGATTDHMTQPKVGTLMIPVPPQFNALSADTDLVTVSIGGNDIGFGRVVQTCFLASLTNPWGAPCQAIYTAGGTDQLASSVAAAAPRVATVLRGIRARAPRARILLVGYMDILPTAGPGCWPGMPIAAGDLPYLRGVELQLNDMLARQASANRARYVDTYTPTIGHDVCTFIGTKWVEGLVPTSPAAPVHPNALGMQAAAAAVLAALR